MKFEFEELLNIKICLQEACEKYGTKLNSLEEEGYTNNHYYSLIKKEYKEYKKLYDKFINILKDKKEIK